MVNMKGNNFNSIGTANSVSIIISCIGWINKLLSVKKLEPKSYKYIFSNKTKEYRKYRLI